MSRLIPGYLNSLRARLVLAFAAIVAVALILVLATLPTLLDGYFAQQARVDLNRRTGIALISVAQELAEVQAGGGGAPRPILQPTAPLTASDAVVRALGTAEEG